MGHSSDNVTKVQLPQSIGKLLATVRRQLRKYSVLSGVLACLIVAALFFWVTAGVDAGWFALQRLELPVGFRAIIWVGMLVGAIWLLVSRIFVPLVRRHKDQEIALLLERRFPQFQDRLVTTVEGSKGYPASGAVVDSMLQKTARDAGEFASSVSSDDVFELKPLKWRGWMAGLLCLSIAGCGVVEPGSLVRWWKAFIRCEGTYHLRTTDVDFRVVAQPGDRRLEFKDVGGAKQYLHPRGADFELEMTVPEGKSEAGDDWVVPERLRIDIVREDGTRSRTYVSASSSRTFRFILTRLQETVSIEVLAGDFRTRTPLKVESVTPPSVDSMHVECTYPEYTGWNRLRERSVAVLGSEVSLPMGTQFELFADSNKPLVSARIVTDLFELTGDQSSCELIAREGYEVQFQADQPLLSEDGKEIRAKFLLKTAVVESDSATSVEVARPVDQSILTVPPNTSLRFSLHDEDDIISMSAETIRLRGIPDRPPVIATRTTGVSNSITRRAIIPMIGTIQDDYGLESAVFQFNVDDESTWRVREFRQTLSPGVTEFALETNESGRQERFDVQPLELTEGQTLSLAVVATDGCTELTAQTSRAEPVVFRIVSNEELLSLLYTRELNMRKRFEQVIARLEQIQTDLEFHQDVTTRIEAGSNQKTAAQDRVSLTDCARRSGDSLRSQSNELESIASGFGEVIEQLINNQIPPRLLAENMQKNIVDPMNSALTSELVQTDRSISRFRVAASNGQDCSGLVANSRTAVSGVIVKLNQILENVRDMAEFHEVLADLNGIIKDMQEIQKETNAEQIKSLGRD